MAWLSFEGLGPLLEMLCGEETITQTGQLLQVQVGHFPVQSHTACPIEMLSVHLTQAVITSGESVVTVSRRQSMCYKDCLIHLSKTSSKDCLPKAEAVYFHFSVKDCKKNHQTNPLL